MGAINSTNRGKVTLLQLAAATYLMVSGGPYGMEELVQSCGYEIALGLLFVIPLLWSLPVALMVGELTAAIPAEGGFYVWVRRAMGPFWGFQEVWLYLMASIFDMAVYPTLFVLSLGQIWPLAHGPAGSLIAVIFVLICIGWNLFGAAAVGEGSTVLCLLLLSPFLVMAASAIFREITLDGIPSGAVSAHTDWPAGVLVAMWSYMGWENASTVAGEVQNPQRTYPRVMLTSVVIVFLSYVIPIAAMWKMRVPSSAWATGTWVKFASLAAGRWLGIATLLGAMVSTLGTFNSLTLSLSRLPLAIAKDGYAPRFLSRTLPNGAPWAAIVSCGAAWICALKLNFDRLLMLDILLYGASLMLDFIALAWLRIREPNLNRPFEVPGGRAVALGLGVGPAALLVIAGIRSRAERIGKFSALEVGLVIMALGGILYWAAKATRKQRAQLRRA